MKPLDARRRLEEQFESAHLDAHRLEPWAAWKTFKEFLKTEVEGAYDAAAVQLQGGDGEQGVRMFLVRQFTVRDDLDSDADDELLGRLIVEFQYELGGLAEERDVWTLDYRTLEEWATVVEGEPSFQTLINREPSFTDVYYDAGAA